eukprot:TRINITY_DN21307_c0_g1_i2.p1 TRINITY_DN21307_c0_g1~~TRINITY_DN21307_c0_g1_i2.p1  ORF type:complete len:453 (+),score=41.22 TRINITY_DN21307_c0_g1_i2:149-1507(+)
MNRRRTGLSYQRWQGTSLTAREPGKQYSSPPLSGTSISKKTQTLGDNNSLEKTGKTGVTATSNDTIAILTGHISPPPPSSAQWTNRDTYYPAPDALTCMTDLATWRSDGGPCDSDVPSWKKVKLLGVGRHGSVYEGVDTSGVLIAVKVIEVAMSNNIYPQYREEVKILQQLQHSNLVTFYGCTHEEGIINIFMEHCPGGSIANLISRNGPLSLPHIRNYTKQILKGLAHLHSCGFTHGDIKGTNILIGLKGVLKIIDIATDRTLETELAKQEEGGGYNTLIGTPAYLAPEVVHCPEMAENPKSDIWSVGCTVIEMLGHHPWDASGVTPFALIFMIGCSEGPPAGLPRDIPLLLEDMVLRCFERDPDERPDAEELLTDPFFIPSLSTHNYVQHTNITTITEDPSLGTSLATTVEESSLHSSCELDHYCHWNASRNPCADSGSCTGTGTLGERS